MGLLDDAIREHLELKRLRGADPGEVAHEEQEALGSGGPQAVVGQDGVESSNQSGGSSKSIFADPSEGSSGKFAETGQETVEINMDAELNRDTGDARETDNERGLGSSSDSRMAAVNRSVDAYASSDESLEWEMPGDRLEASRDVPAQISDAELPKDRETGGSKEVDDVLEETPDFLRETPEQERLWFEQRPPRDFDFNE